MTIPAFWDKSWTAPMVNHLWQSTVVVGIAWLLALALRKNHARVRYWVWMAASVKFLLPFSLLVTAGERLRSLVAVPAARPAIAAAIEQITQPLPQAQFLDAGVPSVAAHQARLLPILLVTIWACGTLVVLIRFGRGWWKVYAAKRAARPLELAADVPVLSSPCQIEPGIFGIFRPVILLPEGIFGRLTAEQVRAIVTHEMCHMRRRDNLTFAVQMLVETLFWFHPAVWWIGTRLVEERERACDEAVVQSGTGAQVYAEGILNVCKFYVASPLTCVSGVTGSDLKQRIVRIMDKRVSLQLTWRKKLLLGTVVVTAATVPVVLGLAQVGGMPDWEKAAGGKQAFEVASVRENKTGGRSYSNFLLDNGNAYSTLSKDDALAPTGSLFSAMNQILMRYIIFAYKLGGTQELALRFDFYKGLEMRVPGWVKNDRYDIEARAPGTATKDQMRLMMQSLLEERFKLAVHWETRQAPVFALVLGKPGKLGPQLKRHPASDDCSTTAFPDQTGKGANTGQATPALSALPIPCGEIAHLPASAPGSDHFGGRDVALALLAQSLPTQTGMAALPRPVIDETGLAGGYDFSIEWTPEDTSEVDNHETGGSFRDALKEQLGLKLVPKTGPVEVLVIDHVERPSPN